MPPLPPEIRSDASSPGLVPRIFGKRDPHLIVRQPPRQPPARYLPQKAHNSLRHIIKAFPYPAASAPNNPGSPGEIKDTRRNSRATARAAPADKTEKPHPPPRKPRPPLTDTALHLPPTAFPLLLFGKVAEKAEHLPAPHLYRRRPDITAIEPPRTKRSPPRPFPHRARSASGPPSRPDSPPQGTLRYTHPPKHRPPETSPSGAFYPPATPLFFFVFFAILQNIRIFVPSCVNAPTGMRDTKSSHARTRRKKTLQRIAQTLLRP